MNVREVAERAGLNAATGGELPAREVTGAYCGDLLSDVIARSQQGQLWITIQVHVNIVAVAVLKELAGIVIVNGRVPTPETVARAAEENVVLLTSGFTAFELSGKLHGLGLGGPP
jgi:hypothetical protein